MIVEALAIGGLGLAAALGLGVAARVFYVEVDPLVEAVEESLPGANCGGCGFAGCSGAAEAIAAGKAPANICVGGGPEVQAAVAAILGVEITETEPQLAQVGCRYPVKRADVKFDYAGMLDCRGAMLMAGGPKECPVGCIGLGSCARACPFDALSISAEGLPMVDEFKCTGCGTCVRTCPVGIMQLTSVTDRIINEYTTDECTAPCQRTCPAGINIPEQIRQTALGNYDQALLVIKERNPLPLVCGRICPHPCEMACRRNLNDEPVAINPLKRFVSDYERNNGLRLQPYRAPATDRKVAIIGGGAEGLSAGWFLARLGHSPTIFEALPKLGGLLRTVIPPSRLPREVLDWEIEGILEMGVAAHTGMVLGKDVTLPSLFEQGFESVLLATGGWDSLLLRGQNPEPAPGLPQVFMLLPLTLAWALGRSVDLGAKTAVAGGGKESLDAARQAKKRGASQVTLLWPGKRPHEGALAEAFSQAESEGVELQFQARVTGLRGRGDKITHLEYLHQEQLGEMEIDSIVTASGRLPELIIAKTGEQDEVAAGSDTAWNTILPYLGPLDRPRGLFEEGEPVSDYTATVEAIGAGRRAAASIHARLTGQPVMAPAHMIVGQTPVLDVIGLDNLLEVGPRQKMPMATPEQRLDLDQEVDLGLSEEQAKAEAKRCLNCGLICYYRSRYN